ncbi:MAG: hypothetical protein J6A28_02530 [Clostridia bacterium]|nr:hypothetical protein [Clostridia bacterium]
MKRMIAFFMCALAMFLLKGGQVNNLSVFDRVEKVVLVLSEKNENFTDALQNGNDFYYTFDKMEAMNILPSLDEMKCLKGVNLYFSKELSLSYFQERLDFLGERKECVEMDVYYGFYRHYKKFELVDGKKVNVQLVFTGEQWIMGLPIILTGF